MNRRALHVTLGEQPSTDWVERWLAGYEIEVDVAADVFAAASYIVHHAPAAPAVVVIGTDWLIEDEFRIFEYAREVWPDVPLIAYGAGAMLVPRDPADRTIRCLNHRALVATLIESPETLFDRVVRRGGRDVALPRAVLSPRDRLDVAVLTEPAPSDEPERPRPADPVAPRMDQVRPKAALTPAEWTALLDEIDG